MIQVGATASVYPEQDPVDDFVWADKQNGLAGIWCIDHLQGWIPRGVNSGSIDDPHAVLDPFVVLAAGVSRTQRIRVGVAVSDPIRRPSYVLLNTALSVGVLGARPMVLGLGAGAAVNLAPYGLDQSNRVATLANACEEIDRARNAKEETTSPIGLAKRMTTSLWIAAHGKKMIALTARYGDGWLPSGLSPEEYASRLDAIRQQAMAQGRDPDAITPAIFAWACLADSHEEGVRLLQSPFARYAALFRDQRAFERCGGNRPLGARAFVPSDLDGPGAQKILEAIPMEAAAEFILYGGPEEIADRLTPYLDAGCEYVVIHDVGRYVDSEGIERSRESLTQLTRALGTSHPEVSQ